MSYLPRNEGKVVYFKAPLKPMQRGVGLALVVFFSWKNNNMAEDWELHCCLQELYRHGNVLVKCHTLPCISIFRKYLFKSPSSGWKAVQVPHQRSISGDQMPTPSGKLADSVFYLFSSFYYTSQAVYVNMVNRQHPYMPRGTRRTGKR